MKTADLALKRIDDAKEAVQNDKSNSTVLTVDLGGNDRLPRFYNRPKGDWYSTTIKMHNLPIKDTKSKLGDVYAWPEMFGKKTVNECITVIGNLVHCCL